MDIVLETLPLDDSPQDQAAEAERPSASDRIGEIVLHSEPVVQILGVPPRWLVRWGATAMAGVLLFLVGLAWTIHYPDVAPASVVITTPMPPAIVVAQASGHLIKLTVQEGDLVEQGTVLGQIQNSADPDAVARVSAALASWGDDPGPSHAEIAKLAALPLGELQGDFAAVARAHAAYAYHQSADPIGVQMRALTAQLAPLRDRIASLQRQREILVQEIAVTQRGYARTTELARHQDASLLTLDEREHALLTVRRTHETVVADVANSTLELNRVEQALTELGVRDRLQREELREAFREAVKTLGGKLALWERSYVLRAPISGKVSLSHYWTDSQFIRSGDNVMAIVPMAPQTPVGKVSLPISRAGSVQIGQKVFIRLDNYPGEQFGLLRGSIAAISPVPQAAHYAVEVALTEGLVTTFGRQLVYQQEMQGQAEIVVEDLRVIDRIFYQFRRLMLRAPVAPLPQAKPGMENVDSSQGARAAST